MLGHRKVSRLLVALLVFSPALGQTMTPTRESPNDYPSALPPRKGPSPPAMVLELSAEIPIPLPRSAASLEIEGDRIRIAVDGGSVVIAPRAGASAQPDPATDLPGDGAAAPADPWVVSANGRYRVRTLPEGRVLAERRCFWSHTRWHHAWSLRVGGPTKAPPLIAGHRVFYASIDNQIYAVRLENGHRLWAVDLEDRISMPLAVWKGIPEAAAAPPSLHALGGGVTFAADLAARAPALDPETRAAPPSAPSPIGPIASDAPAPVSSPEFRWPVDPPPPLLPVTSSSAPDSRPPIAVPTKVEAVVVVPDGGASLMALDVYDGSRLAVYEPASADEMLVSPALVLSDGRLAVARAGYASEGAALLLLHFASSGQPAKTVPN